MNKKTITFLSVVIIVGFLFLGLSIYRSIGEIKLAEFIYWLVLASLCQSFLVIFNENRSVSVVFVVIFAVQLLYGTYFSVLIAAGSQILFVYKKARGDYKHIFSVPIYKILFNVANFSIAAYLSGMLLDYLAQRYQLNYTMVPFILLIVAYTLIFAALNTGILMKLMSLLDKKAFIDMWKDMITWIFPNFVAIIPFGYFIALLYHQRLGNVYIILLIGPLLLARHSFHLYQDSKLQYYKTIKALTASIEAKDPYTEGHSRRVELYAGQIAKKLGLDGVTIHAIEVAALLHDIGKIGIQDSILNKKGKLIEPELSQIRSHPQIGLKILEDVELPRNSKAMIEHHHERYDGNGYPSGLKGDEVPIEAYILSAADAYDAMTSDRPYRKAMTPDEAMDILLENRGTQFHPKVVDAFIKILAQEQTRKGQ